MLLTLLALSPASARAQDGLDWDALGDEAVALLRHYLQVRTVNPPGDEILAAEFFQALFEAEGIEYELFESEPGRGNLVARLRGDGTRGGHVVLLNHTDVVPVNAEFWSVDPFAGEIVDGRIYGRGVTDMKAYGIVQFMAMAALHRSGVRLGRDVLFMATAAEETGGREGAGFIVQRRPDLLEGVEFVLTEGGGSMQFGDRLVHGIETTQKTPLWLRLTARGQAGHGSQALTDSAANRMIGALEKIRTYRPQLRLVEPVAAAIRASAELSPDPEMVAALRDIEHTIGDAHVREAIEPRFGNLLRNTIAITVLEGSTKTNVISPVAYAELDCRLLPGESPDLFIATLQDVIDDPSIEIETLLRFEPSESSPDTALWRAIDEAARGRDPDALVVPAVLAGFTDSHFFRERGIVAYGWDPIRLQTGDGPAHGVDERVTVDSVRQAPRLLFDVLSMLAVPTLGDQ